MKASSPRKEPLKDFKLPSVVFDLLSREMLEYFANQPTPLEKRKEALENFGFQCGTKILLLVSMNHKLLFKESIDYIKHIAIDVWSYVFRSPIEKVKTEYGGRHDLYIRQFEWISVLSNNDMRSKEYQEKIALYLRFICGILRGALMEMGVESQVEAEQRPEFYVFSINLNKRS